MSTQAIRDYLTKQIFIQHNVVTYRTLSRALRIHVNNAKNELAAFHAIESKELGESVATFLVSGERESTPPSTQDEDYDMEEEEDEDERITRIEMMLIAESELEETKAQLVKVHSIHIHSLAPSVIRLPALLYPKDTTTTSDEIGKILSTDVKRKKGKGKGKTRAEPPKPVEKPKAVEAKSSVERKPSTISKTAEDVPKELKPRPSGKLDFSKAKTKEQKVKEKAEGEAKEKAGRTAKKAEAAKEKSEGDKDAKRKASKETNTVSKKDKEATSKTIKPNNSFFNFAPKKDSAEASSNKQRGTKRKVLVSDSEAEDSGAESSSSTRAVVSKATSGKKAGNVVYSDDDDEASDVPRAKRLVKGKRAPKKPQYSDEDEATDIMDVDDDDVEDLTHRDSPSPSTAPPTEDEIHSESDATPPPQKKARKPKKVIPVGSNGVKKRRIVKTRVKKDEKGYDIREDYSSYESVGSDEELEEPKKKKAKVETKAVSKNKATDSDSEASEKQKRAEKDKQGEATKPRAKETLTKKSSSGGKAPAKGKGKPAQSKLANFFGPSISKK